MWVLLMLIVLFVWSEMFSGVGGGEGVGVLLVCRLMLLKMMLLVVCSVSVIGVLLFGKMLVLVIVMLLV